MTRKISPGIILANLVVLALAIVTYLNMNNTQPLYPLNGMVTDMRTPIFEWSGLQDRYELLIDENPGFETPVEFEVAGNRHQLEKELEFGTYWWKVKSGDIESPARKFTVVSTVTLSRLERNLIKNSGNTALLVHRSGITGAVTLPVNQTLEIGEKENVKAEQK